MLISLTIILTLILVSCISIMFTYREDLQNKKYFLATFTITMVGTFSGVLMAIALSNLQNELKEKGELGAIVRQADVEVKTVAYLISDELAYISSVLEDGIGHSPPTDKEMSLYKEKLLNIKYNKAVIAINFFSKSELIDKLPYCDLLYNSTLSPKYIFPICRPLKYLLGRQDKLRDIIKSENVNVQDKFEAIVNYYKISSQLRKLMHLTTKTLDAKASIDDKSEIESLAGFSQLQVDKNGKQYHVTPIQVK
jgi:hypothetical protein